MSVLDTIKGWLGRNDSSSDEPSPAPPYHEAPHDFISPPPLDPQRDYFAANVRRAFPQATITLDEQLALYDAAAPDTRAGAIERIHEALDGQGLATVTLRRISYFDWQLNYNVVGLELRLLDNGEYEASATVRIGYIDEEADPNPAAELGIVLARLDPPMRSTNPTDALMMLLALLRSLAIIGPDSPTSSAVLTVVRKWGQDEYLSWQEVGRLGMMVQEEWQKPAPTGLQERIADGVAGVDGAMVIAVGDERIKVQFALLDRLPLNWWAMPKEKVKNG